MMRKVTFALVVGALVGGFAAPGAVADPGQTIPGDGVFRVGVDVAPGTYKSAGPSISGSMCSWSTHSSVGVSMDDMVDGNASSGQLYANIPATVKAFETIGCQTWVRVS